MTRSFYVETKRISNIRAREELGWAPRFENYKQGLMATLKTEIGAEKDVWLAGYISVPVSDMKSIKQALPQHIELTRQETGCKQFRVWQDTETPSHFNVVECFASPSAFLQHQKRMKNSEWARLSKNAQRHYDIIGLKTPLT